MLSGIFDSNPVVKAASVVSGVGSVAAAAVMPAPGEQKAVVAAGAGKEVKATRAPLFSYGKTQVDMNFLSGSFIAAVMSFTQQGGFEDAYNVVLGYGEKTDSHESLTNTILTALGARNPKTPLLQGNAVIELMLKTNYYKVNCDAYLRTYFQKDQDDSIKRTPELIVRILRNLILNVVHHIKGDKEALKNKYKHLVVIFGLCLFVLDKVSFWAHDVDQWTKLFATQEHLLDFITLIENLQRQLFADLKELADQLRVNELPISLNELKTSQEDISASLPIALLKHLVPQHIVENFIQDARVLSFFSKEGRTYKQFCESNIPKDIKDAVSEGLFYYLYHVIFGRETERIRDDFVKIATEQVTAQVKRQGQRLMGPSAEGKEVAQAAIDAPSAEGSRAHTEMISRAGEAPAGTALIPQRMQELQTQYAESLDASVNSEKLLVNALPEERRVIFQHPERYPEVAPLVQAQVRALRAGGMALEKLRCLGKNLKYVIKFHPQAGNLFTLSLMPVTDLHGCTMQTFSEVKTVCEDLIEVGYKMRDEAPFKDQMQFRINCSQAIVHFRGIVDTIDGQVSNSLREMRSSMSIERQSENGLEALQQLVGINVHLGLQCMQVQPSPNTKPFIEFVAGLYARDQRFKLEHKKADERYQSYERALPPPGVPRPLSAPVPVSEVMLVPEISLQDIQTMSMARHGLTNEDLDTGELVEELGQPHLKAKGKQIMLAPEALACILKRRAQAQPAADPTALQQLQLHHTLQLLNSEHTRANELHATKSQWKAEVNERLRRITEDLPLYDRTKDTSYSLARWYVAITIVGLPIFFLANLYRAFCSASIERDMAKFKQLTTERQQLTERMAQLDREMAAHADTVAQKAREYSQTSAQLQQLKQTAETAAKLATSLAASRAQPNAKPAVMPQTVALPAREAKRSLPAVSPSPAPDTQTMSPSPSPLAARPAASLAVNATQQHLTPANAPQPSPTPVPVKATAPSAASAALQEQTVTRTVADFVGAAPVPASATAQLAQQTAPVAPKPPLPAASAAETPPKATVTNGHTPAPAARASQTPQTMYPAGKLEVVVAPVPVAEIKAAAGPANKSEPAELSSDDIRVCAMALLRRSSEADAMNLFACVEFANFAQVLGPKLKAEQGDKTTKVNPIFFTDRKAQEAVYQHVLKQLLTEERCKPIALGLISSVEGQYQAKAAKFTNGQLTGAFTATLMTKYAAIKNPAAVKYITEVLALQLFRKKYPQPASPVAAAR